MTVPFRKTHSLEELGEQCLSIDRGLAPLLDRVVPLTEYAWKFRYPGEQSEPSLAEATESRRLVDEVWDAVTTRLPSQAWPPAHPVGSRPSLPDAAAAAPDDEIIDN